MYLGVFTDCRSSNWTLLTQSSAKRTPVWLPWEQISCWIFSIWILRNLPLNPRNRNRPTAAREVAWREFWRASMSCGMRNSTRKNMISANLSSLCIPNVAILIWYLAQWRVAQSVRYIHVLWEWWKDQGLIVLCFKCNIAGWFMSFASELMCELMLSCFSEVLKVFITCISQCLERVVGIFVIKSLWNLPELDFYFHSLVLIISDVQVLKALNSHSISVLNKIASIFIPFIPLRFIWEGSTEFSLNTIMIYSKW